MNYGLYISASGMFSALHRMDTAANNLANSEVTGFKPDLATTMSRDGVRKEDNLWGLPSDAMLEKLGGGVLMAPTSTNFSQGTIETTPNDLDIALQGEGFLTVKGADGQPRYTRDGRMTLGSDGTLVQASTGFPYLTSSGSPIKIGIGSQVAIDSAGRISQNQDVIGQLGIMSPSDTRALKKEGQNLWRLESGASLSPAKAEVVQKAIERSGVDAVTAMLDVQAADRAVTNNAKMITMYDDMMSRSISTFGRLG